MKQKRYYRLINHLEERSEDVWERIAAATMIKAASVAGRGKRVLFI